ncbi:hypothetical protein HF086_011449 [Spodoptera exigua]|uniref:Glycosyltransferase 2-like domain-containing protein n=1 Tax=Spodoptera exigua TaxID=7107 RepID=A0A922SKS4_SPOEX|nr:hypothetical protein HF086_011449 [Spodoptera exigua]
MADISIIIPVHNGEEWIDNCMSSIAEQTVLKTADLKIEIAVYNDGSSDKTRELLQKWEGRFKAQGVGFVTSSGKISKGVGAAKNGAIKISTGKYLCFQDIDDIMLSERIELQWKAATSRPNSIIGSKIYRVPEGSTPRYVQWANNLNSQQLKKQIYTSNGPTLLMPTWFCHRNVYEKVGGFVETGYGTPEDLIFFYAHLDAGGDLYRVEKELVVYAYHERAATFSVKRENIRNIQLERLQKCILPHWTYFTVWNAGKAGRRLVRSLNSENLNKVVAFCDVDKNKIGQCVELYCPTERKVLIKLPVIHFTDARPPLVICFKLDMTNGVFERNLQSLNLIEGIDYVLFS